MIKDVEEGLIIRVKIVPNSSKNDIILVIINISKDGQIYQQKYRIR